MMESTWQDTQRAPATFPPLRLPPPRAHPVPGSAPLPCPVPPCPLPPAVAPSVAPPMRSMPSTTLRAANRLPTSRPANLQQAYGNMLEAFRLAAQAVGQRGG